MTTTIAENILIVDLLESKETLGQIAAKDLRKAQVFKKYGLDFCCGGKKTVNEACKEKGLDLRKVEEELKQADELPSQRALPYGDWSLDFLADFIVNTHHNYVRKNLPDISAYAKKVMNVHGNDHPELLRIHQLVEEVNAELSAHMVKEERVLFPYIKELVIAKNNKQPLRVSHFGTVKNPIKMMEMEHELVGKNLAEIRELSHDYSLPDGACGSYSFLYRLLNEFEEDLHLHIHLENNILFPKALEIEKQLTR
jgi:regulator of cell morphogenesis and NO signaling